MRLLPKLGTESLPERNPSRSIFGKKSPEPGRRKGRSGAEASNLATTEEKVGSRAWACSSVRGRTGGERGNTKAKMEDGAGRMEFRPVSSDLSSLTSDLLLRNGRKTKASA